jgi:hypothetical protein
MVRIYLYALPRFKIFKVDILYNPGQVHFSENMKDNKPRVLMKQAHPATQLFPRHADKNQ